jgi:8-oxo-dGTP pyrophosphatase MutT (NUDIX family)
MEAGDAGAAACALREAEEEIGLAPGWVRVLGYLAPVAIPVSGFAVQPVVAALTAPVTPADLRPSSAEVARVFLRSRAELAAAARWERRPPQSLRMGAWPVFGLPEGRLWGATAVMVKQILRRWQDA